MLKQIDYSQMDERPMLIGGSIDNTPSFYVYELVDPISKKVVYVGQTKNPHERLTSHMSTIRGNKKKMKLAKALRKKGLSFQMTIRWRTWYRHHALHLEKITISKRLDQGYELLNNEGTYYKYDYEWDQLPTSNRANLDVFSPYHTERQAFYQSFFTYKLTIDIFHPDSIKQRGFKKWMNDNKIRVFDIPLNVFNDKKIKQMKKRIVKIHDSDITWWDYYQYSIERKEYFRVMDERLNRVRELVSYIELRTRDELRKKEMSHDKNRRVCLKFDLKRVINIHEHNLDDLKNRLLVAPPYSPFKLDSQKRGPFYL